MSDQVKSQEQLEKILLIKSLGDGKANPFLERPKRKRISFTPLLILYQIHLYQKNVDRGKWDAIYTMKETIASHAGVSRTSVTNFFNSKTIGTDLFMLILRRPRGKNGKHRSNRYWLKPEIREALTFLERKGFFKNFKKNSLEWRKGFDNRLEKWLIPLLEKGLTFDEILKGDINILSTKKARKLAAVEPRKLAATTLPTEESFTTQRYINNPGAPTPFCIPEIQTLHEKLVYLEIPKWQIRGFMLNNSLSLLNAAVDETINWTRAGLSVYPGCDKGWLPRRMPALLQSRINKNKKRGLDYDNYSY